MQSETLPNIILTGEIKSGKSTFLKSVLSDEHISYSLFKSEPVFKDGLLEGYHFYEHGPKVKHQFAWLLYPDKKGPERYNINSQVFESAGVEILSNMAAQKRLLVFDELGIMELNSPKFINEIARIFINPIPTVAIIQKRAISQYLKLFSKNQYVLYDLNLLNSETIKPLIAQNIKHIAGYFSWLDRNAG